MWAKALVWLSRFTGIAKLGRALFTVVIPVTLVGATGAFWAGIEWQQGRAAQAREAAYEDAVNEAQERNAQKREAAEAFTDYRREQIARRDIDDEAIAQYVEDHPDLNVCVLDADGLRLWNADTTSGDP